MGSLPWRSFFLFSFLQLSSAVNGRNLSASSFTPIKHDLYHSRYPWKNPALIFWGISSILSQREHGCKSGFFTFSFFRFREFCFWYWGICPVLNWGLSPLVSTDKIRTFLVPFQMISHLFSFFFFFLFGICISELGL